MPSMLFELNVEMDGQAAYPVVADQRDIARWEVQPFGWPVQELEARPVMTFFRFLAWSVSVRQGLTDAKWDDWNDRCIEVFPADDDAEGSGVPADALDPGQPAASGTPS